jgi:putative Mg2+ transporter-C (MgtC) family protein
METLVHVAEVLHLGLATNLVLAAALGGIIGIERQIKGKQAGIRTHVLIALGAALLTDVGFKMGLVNPMVDPLRMPAQVASGLGFVAGGVILHARGQVSGLTTAASIWVAAAVGVATAMEFYAEAMYATLLVVFTLALLPRMPIPHVQAGGRPEVQVDE